MELSTIYEDAWDVIYNHLQTGSYAISTDNIHSAMNDKQIRTEGYPQVIIAPPKIGIPKLTFNRRKADISFTCMVYHTSAESVKSLASEVISSLIDGEMTLMSNGLFNLTIGESDYDWYTDNNKKIHVISIPLIFEYHESE